MSALDQLSDEIAALTAPKLAVLVMAELGEKLRLHDDPLLTVPAAAARIGVHKDTLYKLVRARVIKKAPGMTDIRIRQSVLDAYGK